jgi:hypothetical protein
MAKTQSEEQIIEKIEKELAKQPSWEYHGLGHISIDKLNLAGSEGWELVLVHNGSAIFKRKKYV